MDAPTQTRILACLREALRCARNATDTAEIQAVYDIVAAIVPS